MHLAYRWFTRLGFEQEIPDHSTFSKNRHGRFRDAGIFLKVFEEIVRRCVEAGLVEGKRLTVDGTVVAANASPQRGTKPDRAPFADAPPVGVSASSDIRGRQRVPDCAPRRWPGSEGSVGQSAGFRSCSRARPAEIPRCRRACLRHLPPH